MRSEEAVIAGFREKENAAVGTGYRICVRCLMDTTDPDISFDEAGICSHCRRYEATIRSDGYREKREPEALSRLVAEIRRAGQGRRYDSIIGVSGGVDSTYTAHLTKKLGLRPLAVHLDNGWNSELAVGNIEKTLKTLGIDLYTHVLDWESFRDLQLAFLKASTPDAEIPTDHAILAVLYAAAVREGVRYILLGDNTATEGGGVAAWSQGHGDWRYIKGIHRRFGTVGLRSFPHYGPGHFFYYSLLRGVRVIPILDYVDYDKEGALKILKDELCWKQYEAKHYESIYTRFYQGYLLPVKFGFDKRRLHLSSLIWSGQLSRGAALAELAREHYPRTLQEEDKLFVMKKLELSGEEFAAIMNTPPKTFWDYPSYKGLRIFKVKKLMKLYHYFKRN